MRFKEGISARERKAQRAAVKRRKEKEIFSTHEKDKSLSGRAGHLLIGTLEELVIQRAHPDNWRKVLRECRAELRREYRAEGKDVYKSKYTEKPLKNLHGFGVPSKDSMHFRLGPKALSCNGNVHRMRTKRMSAESIVQMESQFNPEYWAGAVDKFPL